MISGLTKEYRFEYHDDDDDDMVFVLGVDESTKSLFYCRLVIGTDDDITRSGEMTRVDEWSDFERWKISLSFLPEEQRETIIRDVLSMFGEDIYKAIEEVIKKR